MRCLKPDLKLLKRRDRPRQPLKGKTFVFTGSLDRFSRSEAEKLVESLGGQATSSVSGHTDYVVVGSEAGKKLEQAKSQGVKTLSENRFLDLLREAGADV